MRKIIFTTLILGLVAIVVLRFFFLQSLTSAKVIHIIDGDSFIVEESDHIYEVRLIGFDAPELKTPRNERQCHAFRALRKLKALVADQEVTLMKDQAVGDADSWGRKLRYVNNSKGQDVSSSLLKEGLGKELTVQSNYIKQEIYRDLQSKAQQSGLGIWGINC